MQPSTAPYPFVRPVIILAAPRSGSTLLFETLSVCDDFYTIGGESHAVFERIDGFNPLFGHCDSNALDASHATPEIVEQIKHTFARQLRDSHGLPVRPPGPGRSWPHDTPRLLEKTPKNALRVALLNAIFPGALYIYLYRKPASKYQQHD